MCLLILLLFTLLQSQAAARSIHGEVLDVNTRLAVAGVTVQCGDDQRVKATTDQLGAFLLQVPEGVSCRVLQMQRTAEYLPALQRIGADENGPVVMLAARAARLAGTVFGGREGKPLAAKVLAFTKEKREGRVRMGSFHWVEAGTDGRYEFKGLMPGHYYLLAVPQGQKPESQQAVRGFAAASPTLEGALRIRLVAGGSLDHEDITLPVERTFCLEVKTKEPLKLLLSELMGMGEIVLRNFVAGEKQCGLPEGQYQLSAPVVEGEGYVLERFEIYKRDAVVALAGRTHLRRLRGRVVVEGEENLALTVKAEPVGRAALQGERTMTRTDAGGRFELDGLAEGPHRLEVFGLPEGMYVKEVVLRGEAEIVVAKEGVAVTGDVTDSNGQPVSQAFVMLLREKELLASTVSDAKGKYQFRAMKPGEYRVLARDPGAEGELRGRDVPEEWIALGERVKGTAGAGVRVGLKLNR